MSERKRILFIITHLELGGAQTQLFSILEGLDRSSFDVFLCTGNRGYLKDAFSKIKGVTVCRVPFLVRNINPLYDIAALIQLYIYIKKNTFDIVHTHSPKASFVGRWAAFFAGVKHIVYTVHGWPFHRFLNPVCFFLYRLLEKATANITDKIIVVSQADFESGLAHNIAPRIKLQLIHYGIDIEKFDSVYRYRKENPPQGKIVLTVSALKKQKGIFDFLRLARFLSEYDADISFLLIGNGPLKNKVIKKVTALGLNGTIAIKGWHSDVACLMKQASVFVLTSLWEGLPVALIEAIVSGVPVVATDTSGIRDILKDEVYGKIVEIGDFSGMQYACHEVLKNYPKWSRIIRETREHLDISYWSKERMISQIKSMYEELL